MILEKGDILLIYGKKHFIIFSTKKIRITQFYLLKHLRGFGMIFTKNLAKIKKERCLYIRKT